MKRVLKKVVIPVAVIVAAAALALLVTRFSGCRKKSSVPALTYVFVEGSEDCISVTGLTDKGKSDMSIIIPAAIDGKKVVSIGREAFRDCSNLKAVKLEPGITEIAENAFFNCVNLEMLEVPDTVKKIGTNAVKNTAWQRKASSSGYIAINNILLEVLDNKEVYAVPAGITRIASGVFYSNKYVKEIILPESVTHIESYAFAGCDSLVKINIPQEVTVIEYGAFSGCSSLSVEVPKNVEKIGQDAFLSVAEVIYQGSLSDAPWGAKSYRR